MDILNNINIDGIDKAKACVSVLALSSGMFPSYINNGTWMFSDGVNNVCVSQHSRLPSLAVNLGNICRAQGFNSSVIADMSNTTDSFVTLCDDIEGVLVEKFGKSQYLDMIVDAVESNLSVFSAKSKGDEVARAIVDQVSQTLNKMQESNREMNAEELNA